MIRVYETQSGSGWRIGQTGLCLKLSEQTVHVVDVPRAFDLRDHDHIKLVADLADDLREVIQHPRRFKRVDPGP